MRRGGAARGPQGSNDSGRTYVYVDGTAVRKLQAVPQPQERRQVSPEDQKRRKTRERALSMNMGYVLFLTAAAVVTVFMCVNFLRLQARETSLQKEVTALETQLNAAILENESDYNRIMSGVDMEQVKDVAMNELGMVYAKRSQIVTYEVENRDYVRQYVEVPQG